jgi:urocanate hydratase
MATHVSAMLGFQEKGADVFEYGNFIRRHAFLAGIKNAYGFDGFSKKYIRTLLCEGIGPFRWIALSGNPQDIHKIDQVVLQAFGDDERITRWIHLAGKIKYQGLPARICWLGCEGRRRLGRLINRMVSKNELEAPVSFTRDHIDQSAQPTRETEGMKDWSDAIADWPILNALLNASSGADLVTINSGGMYAGYVSSGVTIVATGTEEAEERLERVLFLDPALCVVRHADAGYPSSIEMVKYHKMKTPMI